MNVLKPVNDPAECRNCDARKSNEPVVSLGVFVDASRSAGCARCVGRYSPAFEVLVDSAKGCFEIVEWSHVRRRRRARLRRTYLRKGQVVWRMDDRTAYAPYASPTEHDCRAIPRMTWGARAANPADAPAACAIGFLAVNLGLYGEDARGAWHLERAGGGAAAAPPATVGPPGDDRARITALGRRSFRAQRRERNLHASARRRASIQEVRKDPR
jgi:hypothetical protein